MYEGKDVEDILRRELNSKLREEWATEFFDFYNNPTISIEDIIEKRYTQADLPRDTNEKFATMAGLLVADEKQVKEARQFIRKYCDPEYLAVYDMYWVGNDEKRMEIIAELSSLPVNNEFDSIFLPPKKKITLDEFFASGKDLAIHAKTKKEAKALCKAFDKMGKKWCDGESYTKSVSWGYKKEDTIYTNRGSRGEIFFYKACKIPVYEFEDVDLDKFLPKEKITLDEFFASDKELAIHAKTKEEAKTLCKAFHKMGKKWCDGRSYAETDCWDFFKEKSAYSNDCAIDAISYCEENKVPLYEFEDIDFGKYLKDIDSREYDEGAECE